MKKKNSILGNLFKILLKAVKYIAITLIFLVVAVYLIYGGWWEWSMYKPLMTKKFDKEEWRLAIEEKDSDGLTKDIRRRCGMYHDLTRNHMHKGMTIEEVEELLGPIEGWSYCKDKKVKCMNYYMGICYSNALSVVPMSLYACFNKKGNLVTYDRDRHCETIGSYEIKTKEKTCSKEGPGGTSLVTHDCAFTPW